MSSANTKTRTFGSGVKIGNWNEDKYLQERAAEDFTSTRDAGELGYQKTDRAIAAVTAPTALSAPNAGVLSYGDAIMLSHPSSDTVLSSLPPIRPSANMGTGVEAVAGAASATARSVFTVLPVDANLMGTPVKYTDHVYLKGANPLGDGALYLWSQKLSLNTPVARFSGEQKVEFKIIGDGEAVPGECMWEVLSNEASCRPEDEGTPIPAGAAVQLRHGLSAECLSCLHEQRKKIISDFGVEHEITAKTRTAGRVTGEVVYGSENVWAVTMA